MPQRTRLNIEGIANIRARLEGAVQEAIMLTAIATRDLAKEEAPKDTEALAESIHIVSHNYSDYQESMASARIKWETAKAAGVTPKGVRIGPNEQFSGLPEIRPPNTSETWVVVGMPYGIDNEYGTVRRGAKPFLRPALLANRKTLTDAIKVAVNDLVVKVKYTEVSRL